MSIFCSAVRYLHHSTKNSQLINFVKQSTCCYLLTDVFNFILFSISFYYSRAFASKKKQKQIHRINTFCRVCVHVQTLHNHHSYGRATNKLAMCVFFFFRCVFLFLAFCMRERVCDYEVWVNVCFAPNCCQALTLFSMCNLDVNTLLLPEK